MNKNNLKTLIKHISRPTTRFQFSSDVYCIGGWCRKLSGSSHFFTHDAAAEYLGLSGEDATLLVYARVDKVGNKWKPWHHITKADTLRVLDYLLASGIVNWNTPEPVANPARWWKFWR